MARHTGKIFGIGLSKTGTKSISLALEILDYRTKHFPLIKKNIQQGDYRLQVLEEYDAITDAPSAMLFPHLDLNYPGSKFILTVRDKEKWLYSCERWYHLQDVLASQEGTAELANFWRLFTFGCYGFNRERFSYVYDRCIREVTYYFRNRPNDLLVLNVCDGEGWATLCPFLGVSEPKINFPHENTTDGYISQVTDRLSQGEKEVSLNE